MGIRKYLDISKLFYGTLFTSLVMLILIVESFWEMPHIHIASRNVAVIQYRGAKSTGFQPVGDLNMTYVYSAYYDDRSLPVIRIVALVRNHSPLDSFICVSQTESKNLTIHEAQLEYIPEPHWGYM
ncbi:hypothetical protein SNE40_014061 [Patella caerulea]|uniref:Uncharacterized protein n=1 Tax=Patella caerulea TaxID=87958 RepID=A0AAN8JHA8_PATCE